jgi:hypothetical protein
MGRWHEGNYTCASLSMRGVIGRLRKPFGKYRADDTITLNSGKKKLI